MFAYNQKRFCEPFFEKVMNKVDLSLTNEERASLEKVLRPISDSIATDYNSRCTTGTLVKFSSCAYNFNDSDDDERLEYLSKFEAGEGMRDKIQKKLAMTIANSVVENLCKQGFESSNSSASRHEMIENLDKEALTKTIHENFENSHYHGYDKEYKANILCL